MYKLFNYSLIFLCFYLSSTNGLLKIDIVKFTLCAGTSLYTCQGTKLLKLYDEMIKINCANCAKYFYCIANYEAVYGCTNGDLELRRNIAKKISDCRVEAQYNGLNEESMQDLEANNLGLDGGDCKSTYGCSNGCYYDYLLKTCNSFNCDLSLI